MERAQIHLYYSDRTNNGSAATLVVEMKSRVTSRLGVTTLYNSQRCRNQATLDFCPVVAFFPAVELLQLGRCQDNNILL